MQLTGKATFTSIPIAKKQAPAIGRLNALLGTKMRRACAGRARSQPIRKGQESEVTHQPLTLHDHSEHWAHPNASLLPKPCFKKQSQWDSSILPWASLHETFLDWRPRLSENLFFIGTKLYTNYDCSFRPRHEGRGKRKEWKDVAGALHGGRRHLGHLKSWSEAGTV